MSRARALAVGVLLLLAAFTAQPALGAASTDAAGPTISDVSFSNGSVAAHVDGQIYLWKSDLGSMTVRIDPGGDLARVSTCVEADDGPNGTQRWSTCQFGMVTEGDNQIEVPMDRWVANQSGQRNVVVTIREHDSRAVLDRHNLSVLVLSRGGDLDSDGLTDERELQAGTGVTLKDTDRDGLLDGTEVMEYGTDPLSNDTDDDGLHDASEINGNTNATVADTDGDGLEDGPEVNEHGTDPTSADTDGDGLDDRAEIAEHGTDPTSADTDGDGLDDRAEIDEYGTDPLTADTDGDGLEDGPEVNEYGTDPTSADTDGDGLEDGPEVNEYGTDPLSVDTDGDGIKDSREVSLGSSPTNGLTTLLILAGIGVLVVGVVALVRDRGASLPFSWGGSETDEEPETAEDEESRDDTPAVDEDPASVLTDEDRVKQLLREHGGRLQQSEVVEQTEWSKSKVSRLLSRMADDGEIEKITLGRKNLIALTGEEPEGAKPPFEE